jgi:CheY-like chemotaxis protein
MTETTNKPVNRGNTPHPLTILVVEDNAINLHLVNTLLLRLGHRVDAARDGAAAVEMFVKNPYDVILMDVMMPVMDGVTATSEIRKIEAERHTEPERQVKIIAVTANSFEEDRDAYLKAGMNYYIGKPLKFNELHDILQSVVMQK